MKTNRIIVLCICAATIMVIAIVVTIKAQARLDWEIKQNAFKASIKMAEAETGDRCSGRTIQTIASPEGLPHMIVLGKDRGEIINNVRQYEEVARGPVTEVWRIDPEGKKVEEIGEGYYPRGPLCAGKK